MKQVWPSPRAPEPFVKMLTELGEQRLRGWMTEASDPFDARVRPGQLLATAAANRFAEVREGLAATSGR
jgi:hypothetical protein